MLVLCGICIAISFSGLWTKKVSHIRKISLFVMSISSAILLMADRCSHLFRGDVSRLGFIMTRTCNFLVYTITLLILAVFNVYLSDLCIYEAKLESMPRRIKAANCLAAIDELLIIITQFTGFYYYFDSNNLYQRGVGFCVSYIIPLVIWIMQFSVIVQYYSKLDKHLGRTLIVFTVFPVVASIVQVYAYGLSLTSITIVILIVALRVIDLDNTNRVINEADKNEKERLKKEQTYMRNMIEETAYALAEAIEAKDKYTRGHSLRVAKYSEMIARKAGKSEQECNNIYLAALLHDVGKIGIPEYIINKESKLTDEEFDIIKTHPVIGNQILQKISQNKSLSVGAHYHHERYDGKGYPEGKKGEEIPEIARIIAVADAFDAMTSKRSYRDSLPMDVVIAEVEKGKGTQFDPQFAAVLLELLDKGLIY